MHPYVFTVEFRIIPFRFLYRNYDDHPIVMVMIIIICEAVNSRLILLINDNLIITY